MNVDLKTLIAKLNALSRAALEGAAELCVHQTHYNVEIEHLLIKLLERTDSDIHLILQHFSIDQSVLVVELQKSLDRCKRGNGRTPALSHHFGRLLEEAWLIASLQLGEASVRSGALLVALLDGDTLRGLLLEVVPSLLKIPRAALQTNLRALLRGSPEISDGLAAPAQFNGQKRPAGDGTTPALDQFTQDLTALARAGGIDPIRGRDAEIRQVIDILLRRRQNNPFLVGEAGVGKTAVVEGFALRVAKNDVPPVLRNVSVRVLDLGLLQAGAGMKGEFEHRLNAVISEVKASPHPIILFIDEAHTLIGAGGMEGQGDAANLLKPALARGELRTIAATTWAEYKKYIEKDPALARRFQLVKVDEPEEGAAIEMLRGVADNLEKHHRVRIMESAIRDAVRLSHRYISGRQLPDKAISVLDTACARIAIGQNATPSQVEAAIRNLEQLEGERARLQREQRTGSVHENRLSQLDEALLIAQKTRRDLQLRWEEELAAVQEILSVQMRLEQCNAADFEDDESEATRLTRELARLEKGLEAIANDEPMVPVCVDSRGIAHVISDWTGIPVGKMLTDEIHAVLTLKANMEQHVIGQAQALEAIARRIRTFRAELDDPGKPVGVFLLVGPSGVGKTETAVTLAELLYGGERNLIVVNLSEYQEAHTVSGLKGAPPGYIGYGKGGVLTEAVRRKPYSVVLLDEVEKAHPDVMELFYNVFDKGVMEDGEGMTVDFRNTLILLTSNLATDQIMSACKDPARRPDGEALVGLIRPTLVRHFKPALLGRMVVAPYYPLRDAEILEIVRLKLLRIERRFAVQHQAKLTYDAALIEAIAGRCTEVDSGARNVDHILTQTLLPELSTQVLERMSLGHRFESVHVVWHGRKGLSFKFTGPDEPDVPEGLLQKVSQWLPWSH